MLMELNSPISHLSLLFWYYSKVSSQTHVETRECPFTLAIVSMTGHYNSSSDTTGKGH
jgi:hypothetical protein